ncbi:hypothetical protein ACHAXR_001097 [Thalassiosira sp. AJA248-18]
MWSFYGFGGVRRRKASKPKKKPKENWFERLTVDQNKQLCKATKLRHVGNKTELIDRLLEDEQTSKFAPEGKYISVNVDSIKSMCRERNLQVSGTKFDLVLRVLHCDNGTTPEGMKLKRAATDVITTVDAATGKKVEKHVPKKRKKAGPSASKVYTRVQKKIESVRQKKYQSHWGSKTHSSDVYDLMSTILLCDIVASDENYLTKDPRFALEIAKAVCTSLTDNFHTMQRPGYDDCGGWSTIDRSLRTIAEAAKPILSDEEKESAAEWIEAMYNETEPYGLMMDTDIMDTVEFFRSNDDGNKSEEVVSDNGKKCEGDSNDPVAFAAMMKATTETFDGNSDLAKEMNCGK